MIDYLGSSQDRFAQGARIKYSVLDGDSGWDVLADSENLLILFGFSRYAKRPIV